MFLKFYVISSLISLKFYIISRDSYVFMLSVIVISRTMFLKFYVISSVIFLKFYIIAVMRCFSNFKLSVA